MPLIEHTLEGKRDKTKIAIERIKAFCPITNGYMDEPYYVAYSGGKDSDALRILFELSGVPYDLVHNHTTVDAPETVHYIRSIPGIRISYPKTSMWNLIAQRNMPPTRLVRYCCQHLKERGGEGRFVATGVRWQESVQRKNRNSLEVKTRQKKNRVVLNADNHEHRKMFEACITKGTRILNPIIDWTTDDVWEFLKHYDCRSNPLYEYGYNRIGCIGCPMAGSKQMKRDFDMYPKYKAAYIRAFDRMINQAKESGKPVRNWNTGQEVFDWWLQEPQKHKHDEMQLDLTEYGTDFDHD